MASTTGVLFHLVFLFIWLFAVTAHLLLLKLLCIKRERLKLHLPQNAWPLLLSITLVDLAALLFGSTAFARLHDTLLIVYAHWPLGVFFCRLIIFLKFFSLTVSTLCFLALLVLAYQLTVKRDRPPTSAGKQAFLLGTIWAVAFITTLPLLFWHTVLKKGSKSQCSIDWYTEYYDLIGLATTNSVLLQLFIPLPVVLFLFFRVATTYMHLTKNYKKSAVNCAFTHWWILTNLLKKDQVQENESAKQKEAVIMSPHDSKFVSMILILSPIFYLLNWPAYINNLNFTFYTLEKNFLLFLFAEAPYYLKPFLYLLLNSNFWFALRTMGSHVNIDSLNDPATTENANKKTFSNSEFNVENEKSETKV